MILVVPYDWAYSTGFSRWGDGSFSKETTMRKAPNILVVVLTLVVPLLAETAVDPARPTALGTPALLATGTTFALAGQVTRDDGTSVPGARVQAAQTIAITDDKGTFRLLLPAGEYKLSVSALGYAPLTLAMPVRADTELTVQLAPSSTTTVVANVERPATDPSNRVYSHDELMTANPGQPGMPLSLPGFPSETASGGVKAPQYFAPGVAGDHGEPIAQYIQVGDFLLPNNLPANAHGNGYADPNLLIPTFIGNVETDAGAFDVRHGNNAESLAVAYGLRPRLEPFAQFTGDGRDFDLVTGWSPRNPQTGAWLGIEIAGGNGLLHLPEHRRQYKINGEHSYSLGRHQLTLFGAGYYGHSRIPGLAPIDVRLPQDTIDPRQSDRTHTSLAAVSDTWQVSEKKQLQFSGFFRTYSLRLVSDFGDGLIRQSEFRTVEGGNTSYHQQFNRFVSLETGVDLRRDAPRDAQLSRLNENGIFQPVTQNDFTIADAAPYASLNGELSWFLSYTVGLRRDEISFDNTDKLNPANSYQAHSGVTSPRGTLAFHAPQRTHLPSLAFSFGEAFHTNDPRIGMGTGHATPIATSRAYQFAASESIKGTEFRLVLARMSNSSQLAKLDPDTGLQENVGPSLVRSLTASLHRHFSFGSLQVTFARATATNRLTGQDVPEAPRLIWDVSGTMLRLPWHLRASGELEYVGRKPLGEGFTTIPVREVRGSFTRPFDKGLFDVGVHFSLASGYSGQTLETLQLQGETGPTERIVGVRKASYAGITFTYHPRRVGQE